MDEIKNDSPYMNEHVKPFFWYGKNTEQCILLLHGFTGSPADMKPLAEHLNKGGEGFPVSVILLPGHGTKMQDMMHCNWKKWVVSANNELKRLLEIYPKVSVIGLSMGGDIALCLGSKYKVDRIVTISAPIIIRNKLNYIAEFISIFQKYTYWKSGKPLEGELMTPYETGYKGMPLLAVAQMRKLTIATFNRLHKIRQPILIVQPLKDRVINLRSPFIIFDNVKSVYKELTLLENSRHNAIAGPEREKLFDTVEAFLQRDVDIVQETFTRDMTSE
ncbi:MAG: alpha/beta hydrolase [Saccharofermentanales bacterium]